MEISDIIKNLMSNNNLSALVPVINLLRENSFDIKKTVSGITPETLIKLGGELLKNGAPEPTFHETEKNGVSPIANIADKDIVYILNRYISGEH